MREDGPLTAEEFYTGLVTATIPEDRRAPFLEFIAENVTESVAYDDQTKAELVAELDKRGIEYSKADTKADLVARLQADDAGEGGDEE